MKSLCLAASIAAFVFASCSVYEDEALTAHDGCFDFSLDATMAEFAPGEEADTKASVTTVVRLSWNAGDQISVINLTTGKALGGSLTANETATTTTFSGTLNGTVRSGDKLAFIYPSQGYTEEQTYSPITVDFSKQVGNSNSGVPLCVYSIVSANSNSFNRTSANFKFLMSYLQMNLVGLEKNSEIESVSVDNIGSGVTLGITADGISATPVPGTITMTPPSSYTVKSDGTRTFYMSFAESAAVAKRTVTVETANENKQCVWTGTKLNQSTSYTTTLASFENARFKSSAATIYASITANSASAETDYIMVDGFENADRMTSWEVPTVSGRPVADKVGVAIPLFSVKYFDAKKNPITPSARQLADVKFIKFSTTNIALYEDGCTFTQSIKLTKSDNGVDYDTKTITASITKVMPHLNYTNLVEFRPKQETVYGSNDFIAYMVPGTNDGSSITHYDATESASLASKDLNNVFYNLGPNIEFSFANTARGTDLWAGYSEPTIVTGPDFKLTIDAVLVDGWTKHDVTLAKTFPVVSKIWDPSRRSYVICDYKVTSNQKLTVTFACWESASSYYWADKLDANGNKIGTMKPKLNWTVGGDIQIANLGDVLTRNSYNDSFFGLSLEELISKKLLVPATTGITPVEPVLMAGQQINPYFVPSLSGKTVVFRQNSTQFDSAPVANHEEYLVISLQDAFGHSVPVTLDVSVLMPTK